MWTLEVGKGWGSTGWGLVQKRGSSTVCLKMLYLCDIIWEPGASPLVLPRGSGTCCPRIRAGSMDERRLKRL